jgi:hypothetical protein
MVVGHTKFDPDWHFGVWKLKWRNSTAQTLGEVAATVNNSSRRGHNIAQLVQDRDKPVHFFQWRSYLEKYFFSLKGLTRFHHFRMMADMPGVVVCRETPTSEPESFPLLRPRARVPRLPTMPKLEKIPGLDPARQWYLYEKIRPFCTSTMSKDITCPKPVVAKPASSSV